MDPGCRRSAARAIWDPILVCSAHYHNYHWCGECKVNVCHLVLYIHRAPVEAWGAPFRFQLRQQVHLACRLDRFSYWSTEVCLVGELVGEGVER